MVYDLEVRHVCLRDRVTVCILAKDREFSTRTRLSLNASPHSRNALGFQCGTKSKVALCEA